MARTKFARSTAITQVLLLLTNLIKINKLSFVDSMFRAQRLLRSSKVIGYLRHLKIYTNRPYAPKKICYEVLVKSS